MPHPHPAGITPQMSVVLMRNPGLEREQDLAGVRRGRTLVPACPQAVHVPSLVLSFPLQDGIKKHFVYLGLRHLCHSFQPPTRTPVQDRTRHSTNVCYLACPGLPWL